MRDYLKKLRALNNYTQEQVAKRLLIKRQYYNLIENGQRQKRMDIVTMQKLAEVFGVPIEQIIAEETKLQSTAS